MNIKQATCTHDRVGDVVLMGRFGGAYCNHYMVVSIENGTTTYAPVTACSVRNNDGTFSTKWVGATECVRALIEMLVNDGWIHTVSQPYHAGAI